MYTSKISGLGVYVPDNVVTNDDLSKMMDTSDEWIQERTGIKERRWIKPDSGDTASTMGAKAAEKAIKNAGVDKKDIDLIIFATLSPDYYFPGGGVLVQKLLGLDTVGALDIRNQCTGFVYGLSVADQFVKTGMYKNVLVVGGELHSKGLDKTTRGRTVAVLFGDGAGAAVVSRSEDKDRGILSTHLHSQGEYAEALTVKHPSMTKWVPEVVADLDNLTYYPFMDGQLVFKHAIVRFSEAIQEGLQANNLTREDIDMFIPHQANLRISQYVQKKFGLSEDQIHNNIQKYGNTTAASIPLALTEAVELGKIKKGDLVVIAAFGSGFTWGSVVMRW